MFEDENEQGNYVREKQYNSNKESLMNNSAVRAAIFVLVLMVSVTIIYVLIFGQGSTPEATATTAPVTNTDVVNPSTEGNDETVETTGGSDVITTEPVVTTPNVPSADAFSFQKGDNNPKIAEIQTVLKTKKYLAASIPVVNDFGAKTEEAVKLFQKQNDLTQTGIVDNALYAMMQTADEYFTLKFGNSGTKIQELQTLLIQKKYLDLGGEAPTTYYGSKTQEAVKKFQKYLGVTQDGIVDNLFFKKLQAAPDYVAPN